jgi:hypothetical protein
MNRLSVAEGTRLLWRQVTATGIGQRPCRPIPDADTRVVEILLAPILCLMIPDILDPIPEHI